MLLHLLDDSTPFHARLFLGPFAGIMISNYYIVHKCKFDVPAMYNLDGRYRYVFGIASPFYPSMTIQPPLRSHPAFLLPIQNWRAALALIIAVPPLLPGLINSINPTIPIGGASHLFDIAWLFGFFFASGVYTAASVVFPAKEMFLTDEDVKDIREKHVGEVGVGVEKEKGELEGVEKVF